jgi:hypothetical protein
VDVQIDDSVLLRPFHDAFAQGSAADFRKQRDNVDSHLVGAVHRNRLGHSVLVDWGQSPLAYSTISSTARWP